MGTLPAAPAVAPTAPVAVAESHFPVSVKATDRSKGVFRFDAVKVVVGDLDEQERQQLRGELQELHEALG